MTLPTSYWYLRHFDVKAIQDYVDWYVQHHYIFLIFASAGSGSWCPSQAVNLFSTQLTRHRFNLMSYDLHGTWDKGSLLAPHTNLTEIDLGLDLLWRAGVQSNNVVLGQGWVSMPLLPRYCLQADTVNSTDVRSSSSNRHATLPMEYAFSVEVQMLVHAATPQEYSTTKRFKTSSARTT